MTCPIYRDKSLFARPLVQWATENDKKVNVIWLELNGCSGNIISILNGEDPDFRFFIGQMINLQYNNSLMAAEGDQAYERFLEILDTEFILIAEGAVALKNNGLYNVIGSFRGRAISGARALELAGRYAKYVLALGTCASYGGISAAAPNPSQSISVVDYLDREVIRLPGCPGHPEWLMGTVAHLIYFGKPELDEDKRPILFYGITIHDRCPRRSFFDKQIFAEKLGDPECMLKLGCKGPITRTDCPIVRWNTSDNWPIGVNTPCIGCAEKGFPDAMEPFITF